MMRRLIGLMLVAMMLVLVSCGGGGSGSKVSKDVVVTVVAGEVLHTSIGSAVISSGVFTNSGTVTLKESSAPKVAQPTFETAQPLLTIISDVQPSGGFTVSYPDTSDGAPAMAGIFEGNIPVSAFPVTKKDGRLVVSMDPAYLPANRNRGISLISIVLGIIKNYLPPNSNVSLKQVGAIGLGQGLVYIPGLLQKAEDAEPTVSAVKKSRGYGSAYVVDYDWRASVAVVAQGLRDIISELPAKSADLVAYSKGGLVGRWTLEELGGTLPFSRAMYLGVPNEGCSLTLATLYGLLASVFLKSALPIPFVDGPNVACLTEMLSNSTLLKNLNSERYAQNGQVDYLFVGGNTAGTDGDLVVEVDSALMNNYSTHVELRTNDTVRRYRMDGQTHFSLDSVSTIISAMEKRQSPVSGVHIVLERDSVEASSGKWTYPVSVTNLTGQNVRIDSLLYEGFDGLGDWIINFGINDKTPPGDFFTQYKSYWGKRLAPNETAIVNIVTWADLNKTPVWNAATERKSGSVKLILEAVGADGTWYGDQKVFKITYLGYKPKDPKTRSMQKPVFSPLSVVRPPIK